MMPLSRLRPRAPRWSVRVRILAAILLVTALGMAVAGSTAYAVQRSQVLASIDERLLNSVEAVRAIVEGAPNVGDSGGDGDASRAEAPASSGFPETRAALAEVMRRVIPDRNESSLGLLDGRPTYLPATEVPFRLEDEAAFIERIEAETDDGTVRIGSAETATGVVRYIATPVTVEGSAGVGVFVTAFDVDAELSDIDAAIRTYALVAGGSLVAVALVGWVVAGRLLRPIRKLRETASRITSADIRERIPVSGHDDVSELTHTVNAMLDRIEGSLQAQQQLLDDVRHELKTPLTIVHGHVELMDGTDPDDVSQTRELVLDEIDRMRELVDDIESLAISRQRQLVTQTPTDAASLTRQVFEKARAIPDHEWQLADVADGRVDLDPARITQALLQLADNAAKFSPAGSPITLGSRMDADVMEFWVQDRGPGIPPEMRDRIFERFGRIDTGRGVSGSGLGLPIVEAIATAHGGRVTVDTSPEGSRFGIEIPLHDRPQHPSAAAREDTL